MHPCPEGSAAQTPSSDRVGPLGGVVPYDWSMRMGDSLIAVVISSVCACSAAPTAADYQPYTCLPPSRSTVQHIVSGPAPLRIAVVGDSITSGTQQGGRGDKGWPRLINAQLQAQGMDVVTDVGAEGASGYVNVGHGGGVFADKIAKRVRADDTLVVFFGSINDSRATAGQMAHATCDTLRGAIQAAPSARLLVIGPAWTDADPPDYILRSRDILRDRAKSLGARFIDPVHERWFVDRPDLIGEDGVHPTDAGHEYLASMIRPVIEQELATPSSP